MRASCIQDRPEHPLLAGMNDARRKEIQRALALIEEAKGILEVAQTQEQDDSTKCPTTPKTPKRG
jgi:hypothetical protein